METENRIRIIEGRLYLRAHRGHILPPLNVPEFGALPFDVTTAETLGVLPALLRRVMVTAHLDDAPESEKPLARATIDSSGMFRLVFRRSPGTGTERVTLRAWFGAKAYAMSDVPIIDVTHRSPEPISLLVDHTDYQGGIMNRWRVDVMFRAPNGRPLDLSAFTGAEALYARLIPVVEGGTAPSVSYEAGSETQYGQKALPESGVVELELPYILPVGPVGVLPDRVDVELGTLTEVGWDPLVSWSLTVPGGQVNWLRLEVSPNDVPWRSRYRDTELNLRQAWYHPARGPGESYPPAWFASDTGAWPATPEGEVSWRIMPDIFSVAQLNTLRARSGLGLLETATMLLAQQWARWCTLPGTEGGSPRVSATPALTAEVLYGLFVARRTFSIRKLIRLSLSEVQKALRRAEQAGLIGGDPGAPIVDQAAQIVRDLAGVRTWLAMAVWRTALGDLFGPNPDPSGYQFTDEDAYSDARRDFFIDEILRQISSGEARYTTMSAVLREAWDNAPGGPLGTTEEFEVWWARIDLGFQLMRICTVHRVLFQKLVHEDGASFSKCARRNPDDWLAIINASSPALPLGWGSTRAHYARRLFKRVVSTSASAAFAAKARRDAETPPPEGGVGFSAGVLDFLDDLAAAALPLWRADLDALPSPLTLPADAAVQAALRTMQRVSRIAPPLLRYEVTYIVRNLAMDLGGADAVLRLGRKRFVHQVAERLYTWMNNNGFFSEALESQPQPVQTQEFADAIAERIYQAAEEIFSAATAMEFQARDADLSLGVRWLVPTGAEAPASWCGCDPCGSAQAPGAYMVELLDLCAQIGPVDGVDTDTLLHRLEHCGPLPDFLPAFEGGEPVPRLNPKRRPDVLDLELGCDEANIRIPQIDLVNELLEYQVVEQAHGQLLVEAAAAPLPTRTLGTSEDRRVEPQDTANRAVVHTLLAGAIYPPPLPIDFAAEEAASLLANESLDRATLMYELRNRGSGSGGPADATAEQRSQAWLGWTAGERAAVKAEPSDTVLGWFGIGDAPDSQQRRAKWANLATLTANTGWTIDDVLDILRSRFVNPNCQHWIVFENDACNVANGRISRSTALGVWQTDAGDLLTGPLLVPGEGALNMDVLPSSSLPSGPAPWRVGLRRLDPPAGGFNAEIVAVDASGSLGEDDYDLGGFDPTLDPPRSVNDEPTVGFIHSAFVLWRVKRSLGITWQQADHLLRTIGTHVVPASGPPSERWALDEDALARLDDARRLQRILGLGWPAVTELVGGLDPFGQWVPGPKGYIQFKGGGYDTRFQSPSVFSPLASGLALGASRSALEGTGATVDDVRGALIAGARLDGPDFDRLRALPESHPFHLGGSLSFTLVQRAANVRRWCDVLGVPVSRLIELGDLVPRADEVLFEGYVMKPSVALGWIDRFRMIADGALTAQQWRYFLAPTSGLAEAAGCPSAPELAASVRQMMAANLAVFDAELSLLPDDPFAHVDDVPTTEDGFVQRLNSVMAGRVGAPEVYAELPVEAGPSARQPVGRRVWQLLHPDAPDTSIAAALIQAVTTRLRAGHPHPEEVSWLELRTGEGPSDVLTTVAAWVDWVLDPVTRAERVARYDMLLRQWWWARAFKMAARRVGQSLGREALPEARRALNELAESTGMVEPDPGKLLMRLLRPNLPPGPTVGLAAPGGALAHTMLVEESYVGVELARTLAADAWTEAHGALIAWAEALAEGGAPPPILFERTGTSVAPVVTSWTGLVEALASPLTDTERRSLMASFLGWLRDGPALAAVFTPAIAHSELRAGLVHRWLPALLAGPPEAPPAGVVLHARDDLGTPGFRTGTGTPDWFRDHVERMHKIGLWAQTWPHQVPLLRWIHEHGTSENFSATGGALLFAPHLVTVHDTPDPAVDVQALTRTQRLGVLQAGLPNLMQPTAKPEPTGVEVMLGRRADVTGLATCLAARLGRPEAEVEEVLGALGAFHSDRTVEDAIGALEALGRIVAHADRLRLPLTALLALRVASVTGAVVARLRADLRSSRDDAGWRAAQTVVTDQLRVRRRDAMIAWLLHHGGRWATLPEMQADLLTDPLYAPDVTTSRTVFVMEAAQALIHRAALGLEKLDDGTPFALSAEEETQWGWMKFYRVWEANRRIFLQPENWAEPELLVEPSSAYEELERTLRRSGLDAKAADGAVARYLQQVHELGRLTFASHYVEPDAAQAGLPTLHLLGGTRDMEPRFFYRQQAARGTWTPWEPLPLDIRGEIVAVYAREGTRVIAWVELAELPTNPNSPGAQEDAQRAEAAAGYREAYEAVKASYLDAGNDPQSFDSWWAPRPTADEYEQMLLGSEDLRKVERVPCKARLRLALSRGQGWRVLPTRVELGRLRAVREEDTLRAPEAWVSLGSHDDDRNLVRVELCKRTAGTDDAPEPGIKVIRRVWLDLCLGEIVTSGDDPASVDTRIDLFPTSLALEGQGFRFPRDQHEDGDDRLAVDVSFPNASGNLDRVFQLGTTPSLTTPRAVLNVLSSTRTADVWVLPEHAHRRYAWGNYTVVVDDRRAWLGVTEGVAYLDPVELQAVQAHVPSDVGTSIHDVYDVGSFDDATLSDSRTVSSTTLS